MATGHPISSAPASRRPSSRQLSVAGSSPRRPPVALRLLARNTSMGPISERDGSDGLPVLDLVLDEEDEEEQHEVEVCFPSPSVWLNSNTKQRKRGRKSKGMTHYFDLGIRHASQLGSSPDFFGHSPFKFSPPRASFV